MPTTPSFELSLHASLYAVPKGYSTIFLTQVRKLPRTQYIYQVQSLEVSDRLTEDDAIASVLNGWHGAYTDDRLKRLQRCPINKLYANDEDYKQAIRSRFAQIKKQGWPGEEKPGIVEWKYHQVQNWVTVPPLAGQELSSAWKKLASAVNSGQLKVPNPEDISRLREELDGEYEQLEEAGLRALPLLLAGFIQAFSQLPLNKKMSAAQAFSKKRLF